MCKINTGRRVPAHSHSSHQILSVVLKSLSYWRNLILRGWCYHNPLFSKGVKLEARSWKVRPEVKCISVGALIGLRAVLCHSERLSMREVGHSMLSELH